jgi:NAD(P)H-dependent FMN reductase
MKILGIAGSLRRASYNRALLGAARELAPKAMTIAIFELYDSFTPDRPSFDRACPER